MYNKKKDCFYFLLHSVFLSNFIKRKKSDGDIIKQEILSFSFLLSKENNRKFEKERNYGFFFQKELSGYTVLLRHVGRSKQKKEWEFEKKKKKLWIYIFLQQN